MRAASQQRGGARRPPSSCAGSVRVVGRLRSSDGAAAATAVSAATRRGCARRFHRGAPTLCCGAWSVSDELHGDSDDPPRLNHAGLLHELRQHHRVCGVALQQRHRQVYPVLRLRTHARPTLRGGAVGRRTGTATAPANPASASATLPSSSSSCPATIAKSPTTAPWIYPPPACCRLACSARQLDARRETE